MFRSGKRASTGVYIIHLCVCVCVFYKFIVVRKRFSKVEKRKTVDRMLAHHLPLQYLRPLRDLNRFPPSGQIKRVRVQYSLSPSLIFRVIGRPNRGARTHTTAAPTRRKSPLAGPVCWRTIRRGRTIVIAAKISRAPAIR